MKSKIKIRLAELNIKQKDIAEEFKITKQTFNSWVTGRVEPTLKNAFRLAKRLDCKVDDLWEWEERKEQHLPLMK